MLFRSKKIQLNTHNEQLKSSSSSYFSIIPSFSNFLIFFIHFNNLSAGLTVIFWLLAIQPSVEAKFLEEIKEQSLDNGKSKDLNIDELSKLVYLHGSICEFLHLFLLVPFNLKCSFQYDILPRGHSITPNTRMCFSLC